jgi:hypothetical protein
MENSIANGMNIYNRREELRVYVCEESRGGIGREYCGVEIS